uniref:F-box and regulator of chromosome condensation repeat protein n=1 Tax=Pithovirus LCPAC302 TaxID=2506593 RepID=A0A481Z6R2_9VIRU|nr:MAG: F-box and regulator of chromosome condensation repeat protein [Pithovirus LCPAC302]
MENIPKDILWMIAYNLSNQELMTLCLTSKRYYNIVCNNKYFWYWRIYKRFGYIEIPDSLQQDNPKCIWDILTMNTLYMFGCNDNGQLGRYTQDRLIPTNVMKDIKYVSCGSFHTGVITTDNKLFMFGRNRDGQLGTGDTQDRSIPTNVMNDIKYVSCGARHTGVITTNNKLFMFGSNEDGRLGTGDKRYRSTPIEIMNDIKYVSCG